MYRNGKEILKCSSCLKVHPDRRTVVLYLPTGFDGPPILNGLGNEPVPRVWTKTPPALVQMDQMEKEIKEINEQIEKEK